MESITLLGIIIVNIVEKENWNKFGGCINRILVLLQQSISQGNQVIVEKIIELQIDLIENSNSINQEHLQVLLSLVVIILDSPVYQLSSKRITLNIIQLITKKFPKSFIKYSNLNHLITTIYHLNNYNKNNSDTNNYDAVMEDLNEGLELSCDTFEVFSVNLPKELFFNQTFELIKKSLLGSDLKDKYKSYKNSWFNF